MTTHTSILNKFSGTFAVILLSSAMSIPAVAQQSQPAGEAQATPPAAVQPSPSASSAYTAPKEGFWGHLNPFARKKWVHRQIDPLNDRLSELDQVNAKNAADIKDVDARAQAGINKAQSSADAANQTALAANSQAQNANSTAQSASTQVNQLNGTVNGLDQYHQISDVDVAFRSGNPVLSSAAREQLDGLAANLAGHQGYILEMEAHSPGAGSAGIQRSERLVEAVKRYLVTEHQIPVYRMHSVAMGNAQVANGDDAGTSHRVRTSSVHIRLMENSLAAQDSTSPHGVASLSGAERP
ncbi:MAG TPA: flagellar motor protein MotB [Terracidiphilus sp.]|nr:flagellar motor protein MotB [Terracidiphilus sp.]